MGYYPIPGRGDYYRGGRGDLWGFLKGAAKTAVGFATGGPLGGARAAAGAIIGGGAAAPATRTTVSVQNPFGLGGFSASRQTGVMSAHATPSEVRDALGLPRRRRLNPANPKALRRALRRVQGFGALAARASSDVAKANRSLNRIPRKATKKRR